MLDNPKKLTMAAYTFHPPVCEQIKLFKLIGNAIHITLPDISLTPYITGNFVGNTQKIFGCFIRYMEHVFDKSKIVKHVLKFFFFFLPKQTPLYCFHFG